MDPASSTYGRVMFPDYILITVDENDAEQISNAILAEQVPKGARLLCELCRKAALEDDVAAVFDRERALAGTDEGARTLARLLVQMRYRGLSAARAQRIAEDLGIQETTLDGDIS